MNKGIVMEINESNIIVMTSSGRFDKLPRADRSCEVGEEIVYADAVAPRRKVPPLAIVSGLVAAAVLCLVLITGLQAKTANGQVVAYVSIDINPSIEIGIDSQEIVRDLRGVNADGIALIANLTFKGKNLEDVTAAILDKAEQGALAKGEGDIVISSTIVQDKTTLNDEAIADKLRIQVAKHIESAHPTQVKNYEVTAFAAPIEIRNEAKVSGVTAGKYAVYLNALNNGTQITIDEIQNKSIHQLAKDNGGMNKLIDPVKPITKTALKELLDEEKSGKLAEKSQINDNNNNNNKGNNNNKNNDNNGSKNNQDNKTNQNNKPNPTSNKNSSWSDFLLNRGNINSNNDTKNGITNNDNSKNDNSKNDNSKNDNNKNDNNKNSNSKNGSSNRNESNRIIDPNGNTNKSTDNSGNTNKNNDNNGNTNKNNDPNKDNNKSDGNKNGDNQKGGSSSDNPGASLKPSPTKTPSPKPKPKDGNNSNSDGTNKDQQADKKQGDSNRGDNKGSGN